MHLLQGLVFVVDAADRDQMSEACELLGAILEHVDAKVRVLPFFYFPKFEALIEAMFLNPEI